MLLLLVGYNLSIIGLVLLSSSIVSTTPYICASLFVLVLAGFPFTIVYHRVPSMIVDCIITDNTRRYVVSRNKEDMDFHATNSASYLNSNANFVMKGDREKIRDISIPYTCGRSTRSARGGK